MAQIIPALGVFSGRLLCVPLIFFFLLSTAFLSGTRSCCRLISCIICTSLRIGQALKESWFLLLGRGFERSGYSLRLALLDRHTSRPRGGQSQYTDTSVLAHTRTHVHTHAHTHARTHMHTCEREHACTHMYTHTHAHMWAWTHAHMCTHIHTCTCTHLHTCTHMYTDACTHASMNTHAHAYVPVSICVHFKITMRSCRYLSP